MYEVCSSCKLIIIATTTFKHSFRKFWKAPAGAGWSLIISTIDSYSQNISQLGGNSIRQNSSGSGHQQDAPNSTSAKAKFSSIYFSHLKMYLLHCAARNSKLALHLRVARHSRISPSPTGNTTDMKDIDK